LDLVLLSHVFVDCHVDFSDWDIFFSEVLGKLGPGRSECFTVLAPWCVEFHENLIVGGEERGESFFGEDDDVFFFWLSECSFLEERL